MPTYQTQLLQLCHHHTCTGRHSQRTNSILGWTGVWWYNSDVFSLNYTVITQRRWSDMLLGHDKEPQSGPEPRQQLPHKFQESNHFNNPIINGPNASAWPAQTDRYKHRHTHTVFGYGKATFVLVNIIKHCWDACMRQRRRDNSGYHGYTTTAQHVIYNNAVDEELTGLDWRKAAVRCFSF